MKKQLFFLCLVLTLIPAFGKAQGSVCDSAILFCPGHGSSFPAPVNSGFAEPGAYYACLALQPNPTWIYMYMHKSGSLFIAIKTVPNLDVDFACWGPFTSPTTPCVAGLTSSKMTDCSYGNQNPEECYIPNGISGEFYILLITNYSNQACNVYLYQTGGSGTLDCITTSLETPENLKKSITLRNFPNPCDNSTTFVFSVPQNSEAKLDIFDITGRHIQTLFDGEAIKDKEYTINYNCEKNSPGISIYKLTTRENTVTGKLIHTKTF